MHDIGANVCSAYYKKETITININEISSDYNINPPTFSNVL